MGNTLAAIRARLQAAENKNNKQFDNAGYAFWNIPTGKSARIRFVPDGDPTNDFFWVEKLVIKLPFPGVKGANETKPVTVTVPCVEMWRSEYPQGCPILSEVRPWYKDESMKETANKYWKKRSYLTHGFVRENPLADDNAPENPIRRFVLSPQIFNIIKQALLDPEVKNLPTDFDLGTDFIIVKTQKPGTNYADYSTSKYSRNDTALTADERAAIEKFPLANLSDFLPKKPTEIELKVIKEMFEASVEGELYDPARWSQYYKPFGLEGNSTDATPTPVEEETSEPVVETKHATKPPAGKVQHKEEVKETAPADNSKDRAAAILAKIQNRHRETK